MSSSTFDSCFILKSKPIHSSSTKKWILMYTTPMTLTVSRRYRRLYGHVPSDRQGVSVMSYRVVLVGSRVRRSMIDPV